MEDHEMQVKTKFQKSVQRVIAFAIVLVVLTTIAWAIASSGGRVRISRTEFVSNGGATMSGWMYTPKGVSDENPAPAIVDFHGRNTTAYNIIAWAIEQSRRGYVVFLPDQQRTNESLAVEGNTTARIAVSAVQYLESQDFITEVSAAGHSAGNGALRALIQNEEVQKSLKNIVSVGNMFLSVRGVPEYTNYLSIEAQKDFYVTNEFKIPTRADKLVCAEQQFGIENLVEGKVYGDPKEGTAREFLMLNTTHQQQMYSGPVIEAMLSFIELSSPAPNPIRNDSQVFWWCYIVLALCTIVFVFLIAEFAHMLALSPLFCGTVLTERPASQGKSKEKWIKQVALDYLIPIISFAPVTMFIAKHNPVGLFRFGFVNQIFLWIFFVGMVGAVILVFRYKKASKERKLSAVDYGMGTDKEPVLVWKRIRDGFLIATLTTIMMFTVLDIVCKCTGLNYQFFCIFAQFNRLTPERFVATLPYLVLCIALLIVININIATSRRTKDSGNENKDTVKDIIINILLSAGSLSLLFAIEFIGIRLSPDGVAPLSLSTFGALAFALCFPFMMSCSAGMSSYLYRKTGNIWTGVFTSSFILIFLTCNAALFTA